MSKLIVFLLFGFLLTACAMAQTQATAPAPATPTAATDTVAIPTSTAVPTETPSPTVDVVAVMKESIASKVGVLAAELALYPVEGSNGQEAMVFAVESTQGRRFLVQGESKWELKYGWNEAQAALELQAVDAAGTPLFAVLSLDPKGNVLLSRLDTDGTVGQPELYGSVLGDGERDKMLAQLLGVPPATPEIDEAMAKGASLVPKEGGVWVVMVDGRIVYSSDGTGVWVEIERLTEAHPYQILQGRLFRQENGNMFAVIGGDKRPIEATEFIWTDIGLVVLNGAEAVFLVDSSGMEKSIERSVVNINGELLVWIPGMQKFIVTEAESESEIVVAQGRVTILSIKEFNEALRVIDLGTGEEILVPTQVYVQEDGSATYHSDNYYVDKYGEGHFWVGYSSEWVDIDAMVADEEIYSLTITNMQSWLKGETGYDPNLLFTVNDKLGKLGFIEDRGSAFVVQGVVLGTVKINNEPILVLGFEDVNGVRMWQAVRMHENIIGSGWAAVVKSQDALNYSGRSSLINLSKETSSIFYNWLLGKPVLLLMATQAHPIESKEIQDMLAPYRSNNTELLYLLQKDNFNESSVTQIDIDAITIEDIGYGGGLTVHH